MASKRQISENVNTRKRMKSVMRLTEKIQILDKLQSGMTVSAIARTYSVNESTIRYIRKREVDIRASVKASTPSSAMITAVVRNSSIEKMEKMLNVWIEQMINDKKSMVSGMTIRQKASSIYTYLTRGSDNPKPFQASKGWLENFKRRFGLRNLNYVAESDAAIKTDVEKFLPVFHKFIEDREYRPEQIFNVDETKLFYKNVYPCASPEFKSFGDRLTLLLGANATGDFKCKPLLLYRGANPRIFCGKNKCQLPVYWRWNKKAGLTNQIFWDWFDNCFAHEVEQYLTSKNMPFKALLVLDSAPAHCRDVIATPHPNVQVVFLPANTSPLVQPMEQGIMKIFKGYYTRGVYHRIVKALDADVNLTIIDCWNKFNVADAIDIVHIAWDEVEAPLINACWNSLLPAAFHNPITESPYDVLDTVVQDIVGLAKQIRGESSDDLDDGDIEDLLNSHEQELTPEELEELVASSDNEDCVIVDKDVRSKRPQISTTVLEEFLHDVERISQKCLDIDPVVERSSGFRKGIERLIAPYRELLKNLATFEYPQSSTSNAHSPQQSIEFEIDDSSSDTSVN